MKLVERLKRNANRLNFGVDTKDFEFKKLKEIAEGGDVVNVVNGFIKYTTEDNGTQYLIIDKAHKALVNVPTHRNALINELLQETDAVDIIKAGGLGYRVYSYKSKYGSECFSVEFTDLDI